MAGSQQSFEAREERFSLGNDLIQTWGDYDPKNVLITKLALPVFIADVGAKNTLANSTGLTLKNTQSNRALLVFRIKDTNPACLEKRVEAIANNLTSELKASNPSTKRVKKILSKMRPQYPKRAPGTPRGAGQSPSEKSFASAVGQGQEVVDIITALGAAYSPPDANLSAAEMQSLVDAIKARNTAVTKALEPAGNANRARKTIYNGTDGMQERISAIKSYLASFQGGKKSDHYIEYSQAIKGT